MHEVGNKTTTLKQSNKISSVHEVGNKTTTLKQSIKMIRYLVSRGTNLVLPTGYITHCILLHVHTVSQAQPT